ncbi:Hypp8144 [Branchiostoma lanceolatum]|uniref:Hypp8144 protein n=1 Tax=Branchiostoma lanceolatum TaxID=7740 RepID=A0A8K0EE94_BRALA|nr:Hypp8144 [Branchiostoma lanceolatum]
MYLTPIQQKDFILRHMADLYKNMHKVISDRERQLVETEDDIRKLSEELSHREDDVIRMGTEIEMSASRVEDLTAEVRCLEAELAQHREAALSAQDEVSDEEYQRLEAQTELEEVRGQMEAAKRKASKLQVAVDTRETLCAELHKKMNQLQADLKKRDQETQRRFLEMYEKGRAAEQFEQSENLLYDAMTAPAQVRTQRNSTGEQGENGGPAPGQVRTGVQHLDRWERGYSTWLGDNRGPAPGQAGPVKPRPQRAPSPRPVRRQPSSLPHGQVNVNALLRRIKQLEEQLIQARGDQRSESYRKGEKAESDVQVKLRVLRDAVFYYLVEREREQNLQMILEICNYNDKQKKMIIKTLKQKD